MEHTPKKPAFEPVSDEEAKKIRASSGTRDECESATECFSGADKFTDACVGRGEGCACCVDNRYGKCYYPQNQSGTTGNKLTCKL
ncbi:MAG: hypothetical protein NC221_08735 [Duncaniella sp.]|nr:hypothetical protein [Duncaniella sp.]